MALSSLNVTWSAPASVMTDSTRAHLDEAQKRYFLQSLREAIQAVLRDAEAGERIIFVLEKFGSLACRKQAALGEYRAWLHRVADQSPYSKEVPKAWPCLHSPFGRLLDSLIEARNDAMHQGVGARRLSTHAVRVALTIEDAIVGTAMKVCDIMVRNPVCAELWQPVSFVREKMLAESFSFLAILANREWLLLSDFTIARFMRRTDIQMDRKERLILSLGTALERGLIELTNPILVVSSTPLGELGPQISSVPALVIEPTSTSDAPRLMGIVTAFDLL
jgi:hypothetical protein